MLTNRFLNLLQGRLALMKRDVWALELAKRWINGGKDVSAEERGFSYESLLLTENCRLQTVRPG